MPNSVFVHVKSPRGRRRRFGGEIREDKPGCAQHRRRIRTREMKRASCRGLRQIRDDFSLKSQAGRTERGLDRRLRRFPKRPLRLYLDLRRTRRGSAPRRWRRALRPGQGGEAAVGCLLLAPRPKSTCSRAASSSSLTLASMLAPPTLPRAASDVTREDGVFFRRVRRQVESIGVSKPVRELYEVIRRLRRDFGESRGEPAGAGRDDFCVEMSVLRRKKAARRDDGAILALEGQFIELDLFACFREIEVKAADESVFASA